MIENKRDQALVKRPKWAQLYDNYLYIINCKALL